MRHTFLTTTFALAASLFFGDNEAAFAQTIDTSPDRVKTDFAVTLPRIGTVKPRSTNEIAASNWLIGCETMDRDFTDYDQYKEYIAPLGIKRLRMQAGWDKTEKVKGQYDWAWLDHIIDDAHRRGFQPWLQTSYGNHNYPNGGGANLGAGVPTSPEALAAWDRWVEAMVKRYKDKVVNWEIWNEPNFGDNQENTPDKFADLTIRTIDIIKRIQPEAKVSGLAMGHIDLDYADRFFKVLADRKKIKLFDNFTYHDYVYNPDSHYGKVMKLRAVLDKYAPNIPLRQGENGCPSGGGSGRGALWDYDWSELTQAKWDTRRMLGDLGHDIETSVFGLIEMAYTNGPINRLNYKGIIKSDSTKRAIRPKTAYYAIQHVTSIFDNSLERLTKLQPSYNSALRACRPIGSGLQPQHRPQSGGVWLPAQRHEKAAVHHLVRRVHSGGVEQDPEPDVHLYQRQLRPAGVRGHHHGGRVRNSGQSVEKNGLDLHLHQHPGLRRAHPDCRQKSGETSVSWPRFSSNYYLVRLSIGYRGCLPKQLR